MRWTPARSTGLLLIGVFVLGACGGGAGGQAAQSSEPSLPVRSTTMPSTTGPGTTTAAGPERRLAPDFTLELGAGGTFTLSEEARPVYLVFWAEW